MHRIVNYDKKKAKDTKGALKTHKKTVKKKTWKKRARGDKKTNMEIKLNFI